MSKTLIITSSSLILALSLFLALPVFAQDMGMEKGVTEESMAMDSGSIARMMGPVFAGRMLHAWVSLGAAIVIFILALKYLVGGAISRPIMLIGFGALGDALLGLVPSPQVHMQFMWLGSLIFSLSVILGILWMAKIFGVFAAKQQS